VQRNNELKVKELMESTNGKERLAATEAEVRRIKIMLHTKLMAIGNIVHDLCPLVTTRCARNLVSGGHIEINMSIYF